MIMPYIIAQMKNEQYRKIQIRAVSSVMNFARGFLHYFPSK